MKHVMQEYGKIIIAAICGTICLLLLLFRGGMTDFIDGLQPENPEVGNPAASGKLEDLSRRAKPEILFARETITIGEEITVFRLLKSVTDADGKDIKDTDVRFFLGNGTEIKKDHAIVPHRKETLFFYFRAVDREGIKSEKSLALKVLDSPYAPDASLIEHFDISSTAADDVYANVYQLENNTFLLSFEGTGMARGFTKDTIPWKAYRDRITECISTDTVSASDISYWFAECPALTAAAEIKGVSNMEGTYLNCTSLKTARVPEAAVNLKQTFKGCTSLTASGIIPVTVKDMTETFSGCKKLKGELYVMAAPTAYSRCFFRAGSNADGMWLTVYGDSYSDATVNRMVLEELGFGNVYIKYRKKGA